MAIVKAYTFSLEPICKCGSCRIEEEFHHLIFLGDPMRAFNSALEAQDVRCRIRIYELDMVKEDEGYFIRDSELGLSVSVSISYDTSYVNPKLVKALCEVLGRVYEELT